MAHYKAELHGDYSTKTVEFTSVKTGIALVRQAKAELGCTGFRFPHQRAMGNGTLWVSTDFEMHLVKLNQ